jgi:hypothetical protein
MFTQKRKIIGYGILVAALCMLILPYTFFPQFYIPKANESMGYVAPASIEGWALMITGIVLLLISIIFIKTAARNP